jgi:hypothetical protein
MEHQATKKGGSSNELGKSQAQTAFEEAWQRALSGDRLVDVTGMARLVGIQCQTMMTQAAWLRYVSERDFCDQPSRLYDILFGLSLYESEHGADPDQFILDYRTPQDGGTVVRITLKVVTRSMGDDSSSVLIVMLPHECLSAR